jgi:hypothetical protein
MNQGEAIKHMVPKETPGQVSLPFQSERPDMRPPLRDSRIL